MNAHVHGPTSEGGGANDGAPVGRARATLRRRPWLVPSAFAALLVGGLVIAGIVSLSTVLYLVLFAGLMLMCMGGHGHGGQGHGAHGSAHDADERLLQRSSGALPERLRISRPLAQPSQQEPTTSEVERHDQH
jgi:hypothetical protein